MAKKNKKNPVIEQPIPIRKQVYKHLRNQILSREISPSSRLVEAQVAKDFGISRTPVREALHLLEKDGFVESIPRVGYRVKGLSPDELDEIFEIRTVNELLACRWAIMRIDKPTILALEKCMTKTKNAVDSNQLEAFLKLDQEFHDILFSASGSQYLLDLCKHLRGHMLRYHIESIKEKESMDNAVKGHINILKCLKNKDEKGLEASVLKHLQFAKQNILKNALEYSK